MHIELDTDLEIVDAFLKRQGNAYQVFEITRLMCLDNRENDLLELFKDRFTKYSDQIHQLLLVESNEDFYSKAIEHWEKFKLQMQQNISVMKHLDLRVSIQDFCYSNLKKIISSQFKERIFKIFIETIEKFRVHRRVDNLPVDLLTLLNFDFESLENETREFYSKYEFEADQIQAINNANDVFKFEKNLFAQFPNQLWDSIFSVLNDLIFKYVRIDIEDSIMLNFKQILDFYTNIDQVVQFKQSLRKYISMKVQQMLASDSIEQLISFEEQCDVFEMNEIVMNGFEDGIHDNIQVFSFRLAQFIFNNRQECSLFKYVHREDFQNYYTKFYIEQHLRQPIEFVPFPNCSLEYKNAMESITESNIYINKVQVRVILIPQPVWPHDISQVLAQGPFTSLHQKFIRQFQTDMKLIFQCEYSTVILRFANRDLEVSYHQALELLEFNSKEFLQISNPHQYQDLLIKHTKGYKVNINAKCTSLIQQIVVGQEKAGKQSQLEYSYIVDCVITRLLKREPLKQDVLIQKTIDSIKKDYPKYILLADSSFILQQIQQLHSKEYIKVGSMIEYMP